MKNVDVGDPVMLTRIDGTAAREDSIRHVTAGIMITMTGMRFARRSGGSVGKSSSGWRADFVPGYDYGDAPALKSTSVKEIGHAQYAKPARLTFHPGIDQDPVASWEKLYNNLTEEDFI